MPNEYTVIHAEDHAAALYAAQLQTRIDEIEAGGSAVDEHGDPVTIAADQVVKSGTEIGGITIGSKRTAFYAPVVQVPEASKVVVTPLTNTGTKIANIKVDNTLHSIYAPAGEQVTVTPALSNGVAIGTIKVGNTTKTLYAPEIIDDGSGGTVDISGKLDAPATPGTSGQVLATNGQGTTYWTSNGSGGGSTVTVTPRLSSGTNIATITVNGTATQLYAPASGGGGSTVVTGGGAFPLLKSIKLDEDVSAIVISEDDSGNGLSLTEGFFIQAEFELASENRAQYFNVSLGSSDSDNNVPVSTNHRLDTTRFTYADIYGVQVAPQQWLVETHTKQAMYDGATGVGTNVGNLSYNNWNGFNNPPATVNRVVISFNTSLFGKNTKIKLFGR